MYWYARDMKTSPRSVTFVVALFLVAGVGAGYAIHGPILEPTPELPIVAMIAPQEEVTVVENAEPIVQSEEEVSAVSVTSEEVTLRVEPEARTVSITGPAIVTVRGERCVYAYGWFGPGGNGMSVDWGDGTISPRADLVDEKQGKSCTEEVRTHTYSAPGTYTVSVQLWHPGPTDIPETDWDGTAQVTVVR